jgi:hypothetical protein
MCVDEQNQSNLSSLMRSLVGWLVGSFVGWFVRSFVLAKYPNLEPLLSVMQATVASGCHIHE